MREPYSLDALAAAALLAEGLTQLEIASRLGLSQSAVSRLLKRTQHLILIERKLRWDRIDPKLHDEIRKRISPQQAAERLAGLAHAAGRRPPAVDVVPMRVDQETGRQFETFAAGAAVVMRGLLEQARGRVGVAWGSTVWHTVQALRLILPEKPFRRQSPIEFVPLCGDPLIDSEERYADRTSSRIVAELSRAVNGDEPRPAWLGLVPAFIPRQFNTDEIRVINKLIDLVPQYGRIFGPRLRSRSASAPVAQELNMIVTAAGPAKRPLGFGRNPLLGLSDAESQELADHIYGDIGGVLLPRREGAAGGGRPPPPHPLVAELTRRWTGLKLAHLELCASRALNVAAPSAPGVVLLSFGASHAEVAIEAVRKGLVNRLIIGSDLAEAVSAMLAPAPA